MRDGIPRGVRLILDPPPPSNGNQYPSTVWNNSTVYTFITASNYQYIEVPPWLIFTNQSGANTNNNQPTPYLRFQNTIAQQTTIYTQQIPPNPKPINYTYLPGAIIGRTCTIGGLTLAQLQQLSTIVNGPNGSVPPPTYSPPTLGVPTLGFWTTITPGSLVINPLPNPQPKPLTYSCNIQLAIYPDALMGAANIWQVNTPYSNATNGASTAAYFGIYQSPRPLLGEPMMQMPLNTTIDLSDGLSQPSFNAIGGFYNNNGVFTAGPGYDILFSPSGQMMTPYGFSQVFLWVRDPLKGDVPPAGLGLATQAQILNDYLPTADPANPLWSTCPYQWLGANPISQLYVTPQWQASLPRSGEQLLVTIKGNSGATGVSPIYWPLVQNDTPYMYALKAANSP
jgi:hypothetical protein